MSNSNSQSSHPGNSIEQGFEKVLTPFQTFIKDQTTSSVLLVICTVIALIIANSSLVHDYEALLETALGIVIGERQHSMSLHHWINDGLMTLFFFLLGMEMKREVLVGEINDMRRFLPVAAAAAGGMLAPALIFTAFNAGSDFQHGWGIPMATDTAFAVGVLAMLGRHIPSSAFTFLTALAIIDDLGAILVIALFYSSNISLPHLGLTALLLAMLIGCNVIGIRRPGVYFLLGVLLWLAMLGSGIHATVAGILVAMTIPARPKRKPGWFIQRTSTLIDRFEDIEQNKDQPVTVLAEEEQHSVVENVQQAAEKASTPLRRWERALEHPVALFVMPVFALANAGIHVDMQMLTSIWNHSLALGILLGLLVGKGLGIPLFTWLALKLRLGELPTGLELKHIVGLGLLGGMGFTMSIFISNLGFSSDPETLLVAKGAILTASLIAGIGGYLWLRFKG